MANHIRQQIRERITTDLTGLTTTASRVYQSRVYPLADNNLPGLIIYTKEESSEPVGMGANRTMGRVLVVRVQAFCEGTASFDDTVDTICKEVETALANDKDLNSLAKDTFLASTEIEFDPSGSQPVGYVSMDFQVNYETLDNAPDVAV